MRERKKVGDLDTTYTKLLLISAYSCNKHSSLYTHRSSKPPPKPSKRVKEARRWDGVVSREEAAVLDHSEMSASNGVNGGQAGGEFKPDVSSTVLFSAQLVPRY